MANDELHKENLELSNSVHHSLMLVENILKRNDLGVKRNNYTFIYGALKTSVNILNKEDHGNEQNTQPEG